MPSDVVIMPVTCLRLSRETRADSLWPVAGAALLDAIHGLNSGSGSAAAVRGVAAAPFSFNPHSEQTCQ